MSEEIAKRFMQAGMSLVEAARKAELFLRCQTAFPGRAAGGSWVHCYVPGRIEVLGKHTDYAGGRSLLCALERGICALAAPRVDKVIRIRDVVREQECEFAASRELDLRVENWSIYPRTVARRIARNFSGALAGMDMAFASDLPRASGMSSSSALLIATYLLLEKFNDLPRRTEFTRNFSNQEGLATYLGCLENGQTFQTLEGDAGVGTLGGSEDHIAILCSRPSALRQYRFCPAQLEKEISLPPGVQFAIGVSGVTADKTGAAREKYNAASRAARELLRIWNEATGRMDATLFDVVIQADNASERLRDVLRDAQDLTFSAQTLWNRFEQFEEECTELIPKAVVALQTKDFDAFGKSVSRSQELAEHKLGNQIPQTEHLAHTAGALGAIAASAFGAGFGGSVWAMVRAEHAQEFLDRWRGEYQNRFPAEAHHGSFFINGAGPPAFLF